VPSLLICAVHSGPQHVAARARQSPKQKKKTRKTQPARTEAHPSGNAARSRAQSPIMRARMFSGGSNWQRVSPASPFIQHPHVRPAFPHNLLRPALFIRRGAPRILSRCWNGAVHRSFRTAWHARWSRCSSRHAHRHVVHRLLTGAQVEAPCRSWSNVAMRPIRFVARTVPASTVMGSHPRPCAMSPRPRPLPSIGQEYRIEQPSLGLLRQVQCITDIRQAAACESTGSAMPPHDVLAVYEQVEMASFGA